MDDLETPDFLTDGPHSETAPVAVAEPEPVETPVIPVEEAPPVPEPAPTPDLVAPVAPVEPEERVTPTMLAATLAEREKRQAAERQVEELQRQIQAAQSRQALPDPYADPEGYEAARQEAIQRNVDARLYDQNLRTSERLARLEHGKDAVAAAKAWFDSDGAKDPFLNSKVAASEDPYDVVISEWKVRQTAQKFSDPSRLEAFLAWEASQQTQQPATAVGMVPAAKPVAPRASLAAAPSSGRVADTVAMDGEGTFGKMFG